MVYFGKQYNSDTFGFFLTKKDMEIYKEISDEERNFWISLANEKQMLIDGDENGNPCLIPIPVSDEEIKEQEILESQEFLDSTDWFVVRSIDDGTPIPEDIRQKRQYARQRISELRD